MKLEIFRRIMGIRVQKQGLLHHHQHRNKSINYVDNFPANLGRSTRLAIYAFMTRSLLVSLPDCSALCKWHTVDLWWIGFVDTSRNPNSIMYFARGLILA